ncbi:hypothetical protein Syun_015171 [Stephania yunnanensis]|uniref:Uncharacterized protein n=1 Tax=Stephania yunnanensis TaxID=152371 RepID=A0AAP0JLS2_9MAGN
MPRHAPEAASVLVVPHTHEAPFVVIPTTISPFPFPSPSIPFSFFLLLPLLFLL